MDESKGQAGGVLTPVAGMSPELNEVLEFLYGVGQMDSVWWGEGPPDDKPRYWWRSKLRNAIKAAFTRPTPAAADLPTEQPEFWELLNEWATSTDEGRRDWIEHRFGELFRLAAPVAASPAAAAGVPTEAKQLIARAAQVIEFFDKRPRPMCRDCADEDGTCPGTGLPCDMRAFIAELRGLASPVAPAGAPTEKEIEILVAEHLRAETGADSIGRTCAWVTGVQGFARALLFYQAAPHSSVASPAPRSSLRAIEGSELPREPSGEPSGEQPINDTEAAAVPLHNLKDKT